jgi:hypothetical protein
MSTHPALAAALAAVVLSLAAGHGSAVASGRGPAAPAPSSPPLGQKPTRPPLITVPQVTVTTPNAGETLALDGTVLQIVFLVKNFDPAKTFSYRPELLRNGALLGGTSSTGFALNTKADSSVVGVTRGHYFVGYNAALATPGGGYQYRIVVYEGTWGQGHKVVTSGASPTFSFVPLLTSTGPPTITVVSPSAGASIPLDGGLLQISYGIKHFNPNKAFSFMPELLHNGALLGPTSTIGFPLQTSADSAVVGVTRGKYWSGYRELTAPPGPGYQYRISVYEGSWGQNHTVVTSGVSGSFTFSP